MLGGGCFEGVEGEQFYGKVVVPREQEFRWSDGGLPRVFDPARAAAPPDTDAVRALYEGLTDNDPRTLLPLPAVAQKWESSEDGRQWTFHLRKEATWSNGDHVTADDFVRSWQRTLRLGERAPHATLLTNIRGAKSVEGEAAPQPPKGEGLAGARTTATREGATVETRTTTAKESFGAEAIDTHTLRVTLRRADKKFPSLVAHPVFRPVHELSPGADLSTLKDEAGRDPDFSTASSLVTNGAFRLSGVGDSSVVLERATNYWAASSVKLNRVRFVPSENAEQALASYRAGAVDAVSNAAFEPLAVKILTPYKDFRRGTFGALLYYQFNTERPPFNDRRVREAFAVALDVELLSAETLGGATDPARKFLPEQNTVEGKAKLVAAENGGSNSSETPADNASEAAAPFKYDVERARRLLAEAGFPGGANFPPVRLLVNRNEQQRLVAQAVARMWRNALGVETEVVVRDWEEYERMSKAGEYEIVRRSIVMQTTDEQTNILAMFGDKTTAGENDLAAMDTAPAPASTPSAENTNPLAIEPAKKNPKALIFNEAQALKELPAVPVYFSSSYALVKPYVSGFHSNLLDAPSLKHVRIETGWKPPAKRSTNLQMQVSER